MSKIKSEYQRPLIGAYLVLLQGDKLLLSRRNDPQFKGIYSLVCGHVENGESVISAIIREANEEVGIVLQPHDLQVISSIHRPNENYKGITVDIIDFFILAKKYTGTVINKEPQKTQELIFCDINNIPDNCVVQVKEALNLQKDNGFYAVLYRE